MLSEFTRPDFWTAFLDELNKDTEWSGAAKHFSVRIELRCADYSFAVDTRDGRAVGAAPGPLPAGADILLTAPESEWRRILDGRVDYFEATSPGLGDLSVAGDAVAASRNVKAMWLFLHALARTARPTEDAPPNYSPAPPTYDRVVTGRYIDVNGIETYYEEAGNGIPIVCIHAAGQDTLMYRHVVRGLSDRFRVISLDAPGHGKTAEPSGGPFHSITEHADFNETFMDALCLDRPVLVGCSMGGNMVLELAARRPDYYRGVVSCEGADYTPTVSPFLLEMLMLNGPQILEAWSRSMTGKRTPPDRAREVVWQLRRVAPEYIAADLTGYAGFDRRAEMGKITSPVLLIRGDADWLVNQQMVDETAARITNSSIAILEGTGHYPMIENPVEFNGAVLSFAEKL